MCDCSPSARGQTQEEMMAAYYADADQTESPEMMRRIQAGKKKARKKKPARKKKKGGRKG